MDVALGALLWMIALPAAAGAAAAGAARLLAGEPGRGRVHAVGAAIGAIVAHLGLAGAPPIPPIDSIGWIPLAVATAALVAVALAGRGGPGRRRSLSSVTSQNSCVSAGIGMGSLSPWPQPAALGLLVVAALAGFLVGRPTWSTAGVATAAPWIIALAVTVVVVARGAEWSSARLHPTAVGLALLAAVTGGAIAAAVSRSALLAMLLGGLAATLGALVIGGLILRAPPRAAAPFGVVAVALASIALYGHLYASIATGALLLLAASAVAPVAIAALPPFRGRAALAPLLAVALAAAAAGVAHRATATREASYELG